LGIKITVTVSLFGSENQVGFGLLVAPQNRWREVSAETSLDRVSQSGLKNGGTMMGGTRGTITEVASEVS
jgi:hypothetical protein